MKNLKIGDRVGNRIVGTNRQGELVLIEMHHLAYKGKLPC